MWNERDETDPFTAAVGDVMRDWPLTASVEGPRVDAGQPLLRSPFFVQSERVVFAHQQTLDEEGLLGRVFSASYAPREPDLVERFGARLREVYHRHQQNNVVVMRYVTPVYVGRRA
jgi:hypothetical protein